MHIILYEDVFGFVYSFYIQILILIKELQIEYKEEIWEFKWYIDRSNGRANKYSLNYILEWITPVGIIYFIGCSKNDVFRHENCFSKTLSFHQLDAFRQISYSLFKKGLSPSTNFSGIKTIRFLEMKDEWNFQELARISLPRFSSVFQVFRAEFSAKTSIDSMDSI